jgi:pilus assembly protein CpaE
MADQISVAILEPATGGAASPIVSSERDLRLVAIASDPATLVAGLQEHRPSVTIVDAGTLTADAFAEAVAAAVRLDVPLIVLGEVDRAADLSRAVLDGARAFFIKPLDADAFVEAIRQVAAHTSSRGGRATGGGALIAVYGPKGGVGTTTVATSLSVGLAQAKKRVCLVDLDLQFGDVGVFLDLKGQNTVADLLGHADALDPALLDDILQTHSSGLRVLLAPEQLGAGGALDPDAVSRLLERLREHFDRVVVDLASAYTDLTATVLGAADCVLIVTTPELPALQNAQRALVATKLDGRARIVVNRSPGKVGIGIPEIERALGRVVFATIPSDGVNVTQAVNRGLSPLDAQAHTTAARPLRQLAALVESQLAR